MLWKFLLDFLSLLDEEAEDLGVVFWACSEFIIQFCVFVDSCCIDILCFLCPPFSELDGSVLRGETNPSYSSISFHRLLLVHLIVFLKSGDRFSDYYNQ